MPGVIALAALVGESVCRVGLWWSMLDCRQVLEGFGVLVDAFFVDADFLAEVGFPLAMATDLMLGLIKAGFGQPDRRGRRS